MNKPCVLSVCDMHTVPLCGGIIGQRQCPTHQEIWHPSLADGPIRSG